MNITEIGHNKYRTRRMTGALLRLKNILLKFFSFLWLKGRYEEFSYERHRGTFLKNPILFDRISTGKFPIAFPKCLGLSF